MNATTPPTVPPDADSGYEVVPDVPVAGRSRRLTRFVRAALVVMAVGCVTVLGLAAWLNPYTADGAARTMSTHTQLGLPPCNMVQLIGKPCPACGMTTSFSLTMHADPVNAARANWVGMLLCLTLLALVPWAAVSAARGKYLFIRSLEAASTVGVVVLLVLMFGRWAAVLVQG